ncbi:TPA: hypothetical protein VDU70_005320 [Pseudomonas aeruginosa]|uniref:ABC-three component system middle component 5 n=1 Tax=Pseudomonas aeruginosa TaxID=287 RepID=UPI00228F759C|nr:hypothetical protein [Pseudomonas aeruginosa]HEP8841462.1 hypothetical protein [Pseudomonas aeruginosa]HEP8851059.1 hypothetical protein [Pseudomonas aeruginosa]
MIQITFQAAFDPFHALFRFFRIMEITSGLDSLTVDHARILDFYLLYPFRSGEIKLRSEHRKYKRVASDFNYLKPYGELPDSFVLFSRMQSMQVAALDTLVSNGYLDATAYSRKEIKLTGKLAPSEVLARIHALNEEQSKLVDLIKVLASEYSIFGRDGLKARTGLLEYRYDTV